MLGSIEAGGTKFVCGVGNDDLSIEEVVSFPTTTPEETMKQVIDFFKQYKLDAIGVGSFGPIDINQSSRTYGYITNTPKVGWKNFDFIGTLKKEFNIPIAWTTDVNAAAYGEYVSGAAQGLNSCVYYTIGTGVGAGAIINGKLVEGFSHPEMGHMIVKRHSGDAYGGNCPYHNDCLEGMASGKAIEKRSGIKGNDLNENHHSWEYEAYYIAQAVYNTTLMLSPEKIILGGGVMKQTHLLERVRKEYTALMQNYVFTPNLEEYIVTPALGDKAGTTGCLALAREMVK